MMVLFEVILNQRFYRSAVVMPCCPVNISTVDSYLSAPIRNAQGYSIDCNPSVGSLVSALFKVSCPTAIFRKIPKIVINALKRVLARWSMSHIREKVLKGYSPSVADGYSSIAIVFISDITGGVASMYHTSPYDIFTCARKAVGLLPSRALLATETSATNSVATSKIRCGPYINFPAIADAPPHDILVAWRHPFQNKKTTEFLASKIKRCWHSALIRKMTIYNSKLGSRSIVLGAS